MQGVPDAFHLVLKLLEAEQGQQIGCTKGDDANADERGERCCGHVGVAETEDTECCTGDAEDEDQPPVGEADLLVIETLNGNQHALEEHPHGEDDGQREGDEQVVAQEHQTEDDLQQGRQHPRAAVGQEMLRLEGEHHLGDAGKKREAADHPSGGEEGLGRVGDAKHAQDDQQDARNGEPNFGTFHFLKF